MDTATVCCAVRIFSLMSRFLVEARVRSQASPCEICGGQSGTGIGYPPITSVFPVNVVPKCPTLILMLLLPQGQTGEAWEPVDSAALSEMGER
jgi:hypothetical protein